jgi:hypothetical protein
MRELRPVPPPAELRGVDRHRSTPTDNERLAPTDRPARHTRAETAEPRTAFPQEARERTPGDHQQRDRPSDALTHFEPTRAGLPDVAPDDAARYVETRRGDRPWLNAARHTPPEVQRVFAALDQADGHAHIRHEGWVSAEKNQLRVQYLQDPAQLDPVKKAEGIDGLLAGDKKHYCAAMSTAIRDSTAFAEAFARGTEHPNVRRALDISLGTDYEPPAQIGVPITDLLGPDGHRYCEGYQLAGDERIARQDRRTWLRDTRAGERPSVPPPLLAPIDFRGGTIEFRFKVNVAKTGYEVATMFPQPPQSEPEHP